MRTGLFGGTFDPVHAAHLIAAERVRDEMDLDRIVLIPAGMPPHKSPEKISSGQDRLAMTRLAISGNPHFVCSDFEIRKQGISYTQQMIEWFRTNPPWERDTLFLIIGADSLLDIHTWHHPEAILEAVDILVMNRPGFDPAEVESTILERVSLVETPLIGLSSSEIRSRVRDGRSITYMVPEKVENYIIERKLYR